MWKENLVIYQKLLKAFLQAPLQLQWNLLVLSPLVVSHECYFQIFLHHVQLKGMKPPICFCVQQTYEEGCNCKRTSNSLLMEGVYNSHWWVIVISGHWTKTYDIQSLPPLQKSSKCFSIHLLIIVLCSDICTKSEQQLSDSSISCRCCHMQGWLIIWPFPVYICTSAEKDDNTTTIVTMTNMIFIGVHLNHT